jgi:peptidoglycan/LPS O-acetylase OafA/YrhL
VTGLPPRRLGLQPALDGLRGIAVLLVVVMHGDDGLLSGGYIGVDVFFVLSGFLITCLLVEEQESTGRISLCSFYVRRARRLGPALLLLIVAGGLLAVWMPTTRGSTPYLVGALGALCDANNWLLVYGHARLGLLTPSWSLAVEEQFYLLWPVVLAMLLHRRVSERRLMIGLGVVILVAVAATATLAALFPHGNLYDSSIPHAAELTVGCLTAFAWRSSRTPGWIAGRVGSTIPIGTLAGLAVLTHIDTADPIWCLVATAATAVLLLAAVHRPTGWLQQFLRSRILTKTGRISYGMYLYNLPVVVLVGAPLLHTSSRLGVLAGRIAAIYLVAGLSWRWLESPIRRLGRPRMASARPDRIADRTTASDAANLQPVAIWRSFQRVGRRRADTFVLT